MITSKTILNYLISGLITLTVFSCLQMENPEDKRFSYIPAEYSGIDFSNTLFEDENLNIITFEYFYNGAGVGTGDLNNDGLCDIFFAGNMTNCRLYLNKGNFKFEDATEKAGISTNGKWATGVSLVDINQDGWLDIYVSFSGPYQDSLKRINELYINNQDGTFKEMADEYGLADSGYSIQATFFDYDKDGDLDMYMLSNMTDETGPNIIRPKRVKGEMLNTDRLYRNNGKNVNGIFQYEDVSEQAGMTIEGYGLGVSITDINLDGWPDIYVSNDYLSNDLLYINNQNGTFTNKAGEYFRHTSYSAMGNDVADVNNDGLPDIITLDMLPPDNKRKKLMFGSTNFDRFHLELRRGYEPQYMRNTFQLHQGKNPDGEIFFSEIGQLSGISATDWSWAPLLADFDNDGLRDLYVTNGYPRDITNRDFASFKAQEIFSKGFNQDIKLQLIKEINQIEGAYLPNYIFSNKDGIHFNDEGGKWIPEKPSYSSGAAYADFDNDGDLDLVINNIDEKAFLIQNHSENFGENNYLEIVLQGPQGNINAIGSEITVYSGDKIQQYYHSPYRGFQSTVDSKIHFGLGKNQLVDSIRIIWPDGIIQYLRNIKDEQNLFVNYENVEEKLEVSRYPVRKASLYKEVASELGIDYQHQDKLYPDFKVQSLLPHQFSQNGPGLAVGDINNDGLEDFYITGAYSFNGSFFIQTPSGQFKKQPFTATDPTPEEQGALLFDADSDGDLDLYISNGGNEFEKKSTHYQDKLFYNDGSGNFTLQPDALPDNLISSTCVVGADYDQDGDLDLFVGGGVIPANYPLSQKNQVLRNDGGKFKDVTVEVSPEIENTGIITSSIWTDFDNDLKIDLILVGEWIPIRFFKNKGNTFEEVTNTTGLENLKGWWNSISSGDFDNDGDIDYIAGNLGLNSRYTASENEPVMLHTADFDNNGDIEGIISRHINGINYPVHSKDDLISQVSAFKKKFLRYEDYANARLEDVIDLKSPDLKISEANFFQSIYIENLGGGKFSWKPLPVEMQVAPLFGMMPIDVNYDGFLDLVTTGNSYSPDVFTGRYDAFSGMVLIGNGTGNFQPLKPEDSGFYVNGDAKSLVRLTLGNQEEIILSAQNNGKLKIFKHTENPSLHLFPIPKTGNDAKIYFKNGNQLKMEFPYGNGYLSQSSRKLLYPKADIEKVEIIGHLEN